MRYFFLIITLLTLIFWGCVEAHSERDTGEVLDNQTHEILAYGHDLNFTKQSRVDGKIRSPKPLPFSLIRFFIEDSPPFLNNELWKQEVLRAFAEWARVIGPKNIVFSQAYQAKDANITVGFRSNDHEDECDAGFSSSQSPAHAFTYESGCLAGSIHLNAQMRWVINGSSERGVVDVRTSILHELGHLWGLSHVEDRSRLMHSEYNGPLWQLSDEDGQDARASLIEGRDQ